MSQVINIQITVPDGVEVRVNGASAGGHQRRASGGDRPFVARPAPPQPDGYCEIHDTDWRLVPAGTSQRTGKPYNAFWACPERGCDNKPQRAPANGGDYDSGMTDVSAEQLPF